MLKYAQVSPHQGSCYYVIDDAGYLIGMVWRNGEIWQASRYNTIGQPEVTGDSRNKAAEALLQRCL